MTPALLLLLACRNAPPAPPGEGAWADPLLYVDPFIGTGGQGFGVGSTYPGAALPFGMVKLSPDTWGSAGALGYAHCAGYSYDDDRVAGFSHTHLHGTGAPDYGNVSVFPAPRLAPELRSAPERAAPFEHEQESAGPGGYAVRLGDIQVELAAGHRVGFHRYTFPEGGVLVFDLAFGLDEDGTTSLAGEVHLDPERGTLEGWTWNDGKFSGRYGGFPVYFAARVEPLPDGWGTWADGSGFQDGSTAAEGVEVGAWLSFGAPPPEDTGAADTGGGDTGSADTAGEDTGAADTGLGEDTGAAPDSGDTGSGGAGETASDSGGSGRDTGRGDTAGGAGLGTDTAARAAGSPKGARGRRQPGEVVVELAVGISFSSVEDARANLEDEAGAAGVDFDAARAAAWTAWEEALGRLRVQPAEGQEEELRAFYTALYHCLQMPTLLSDVTGTYPGLDGELHRAEDEDGPFDYYSDFSLWDTYRTLHPLLALLYPDYARDFARSLLRMAEDGGYLPRWPLNRGYTGSMIGDPADIALATTALSGIGGWAQEDAFEAARRTADAAVPEDAPFGGRAGIEGYLERGWVASDDTDGAASWTLELAWADAALARWAEALGREEDAARYAARAGSYAATWDPEAGFFRARAADGGFEPLEDFDPTTWLDDYVEGDAWQYLWMVPHDPEGLAGLVGGSEALLARLDEFFAASLGEEDTFLADVYYWHGNEPDLDAPYLYALLGQPERGAPWVRWVRGTRYGTGPDGLDGNDDGGTLSAWLVLSALGLHPVAGTETVALGPPLFPAAELELSSGELLRVEARGGDPRRGRWLGAWRHGFLLDGTVGLGDLLGGGLLFFELGEDEEPLEGARPWKLGG